MCMHFTRTRSVDDIIFSKIDKIDICVSEQKKTTDIMGKNVKMLGTVVNATLL